MPEKTVPKSDLSHPTLQSVDLHLVLFDRALHPELFQHFANYMVEQGRYRADIWIVGLSHVVTVTTAGKTLTELLARDSEVLPTRGVLTRFRLKGERDLERRTPGGWNYLVSTQVETMDEALYKSVHNDLLRHTEKRGWFQSYDGWTDSDLVPFSYIDHEARDREFHVHAFHAYPHERTLVKTQSIIELPE
ncbi:MAG: DUF2617 family protein [Planctomycetota bacterium]